MTSGTKGIRIARNLRRVSQSVFLALFFLAFFSTVREGARLPGSERALELFFDLDPLSALVTLMSTGRIYEGLLWGLVVVAATVVMGRAFCGWFCPMGTLQQLVQHARRWKKGKLLALNRSGSYQYTKYGILAFGLASALAGSAVVGLLDPIAFLTRGLSEGVGPAVSGSVSDLGSALASTGVYPIDRAPVVAHFLLSRFGFSPDHTATTAGLLTLLLLSAGLLAALVMPRLYCRAICPLGAGLGLLSRWSIFGLEQDDEKCTHCGDCTRVCQGGSDPQPTKERSWLAHECVTCLNCQAECPEDALSFRFFPLPRKPEAADPVDRTRRALIASAVGGLVFVPASRGSIHGDPRPRPRAIRPPGALSESDFLERCIRCGACIKICPTNVLQPATAQAGVEGLYTPVLVPAAGACETTCVACSEVCPSGAIAPLTVAQKGWESENPAIKLGTAVIDRGRCLPWANRTPCIVCEEHCPTADKAIRLDEVEETDFQGRAVILRRPHVDPLRCVGCGACEHVCPQAAMPAVKVFAIDESRASDYVPGKLSM